MAMQLSASHPNAGRINCALPLLDFDWKLQYAVASGTIAAVNKPLLRLDLYVSKTLSKVEEVALGKVVPENLIQSYVAEYTKERLDILIGAMDAIEQILDQYVSRIMAQTYRDSAKAEEEADRIASIAGRNLKVVLKSFKDCLQVVNNTKRMLEVDPQCICANAAAKWERRRGELHETADSIGSAMETVLQTFFDEIEAILLDTNTLDDLPGHEECKVETCHVEKLTVEDDDFLWCDRVCVHEKVDMDSSLWCNMPHTVLELVFARLPLPQIFQLRVLSKHWQSSIMSPAFQNAFGTTSSRRFAIISGMELKDLWTFGTSERRWYTHPFNFLPMPDDIVPIVGDGGLLFCGRHDPFESTSKQDMQLFVCNPLTQAWRALPLPSQVTNFSHVQLVMDKQTKHYTITVVDDSDRPPKAKVEVYDSTTQTWTTGGGIFHSACTTGNNLIYFKNYQDEDFIGISAYDQNTGYTTMPISDQSLYDLFGDIFYSEASGFFPVAEYHGQIFVLQTKAAKSGVYMLRGLSQEWEKICSVPKPEILKFYLFSLYVSADVIIIIGDRRILYDDITEVLEDLGAGEPENPYMWMLDRFHGNWVEMVNHEIDIPFSDIMFEMRLDGVP